MVSLSLPVEDDVKGEIERLSWVNWSEVAREILKKRVIFERYIKGSKFSKEEELFCEEHDWHPTDELPLKEEYVKKLRKIMKGPHVEMTLDELDKLLEI